MKVFFQYSLNHSVHEILIYFNTIQKKGVINKHQQWKLFIYSVCIVELLELCDMRIFLIKQRPAQLEKPIKKLWGWKAYIFFLLIRKHKNDFFSFLNKQRSIRNFIEHYSDTYISFFFCENNNSKFKSIFLSRKKSLLLFSFKSVENYCFQS